MAVQILDSSYMQTTQSSQLPSTHLDFLKIFVVNGPLGVAVATQIYCHSLGKSTPTGADLKIGYFALRQCSNIDSKKGACLVVQH